MSGASRRPLVLALLASLVFLLGVAAAPRAIVFHRLSSNCGLTRIINISGASRTYSVQFARSNRALVADTSRARLDVSRVMSKSDDERRGGCGRGVAVRDFTSVMRMFDRAGSSGR